MPNSPQPAARKPSRTTAGKPARPAPDAARRNERSRRAIHDAALALVAEEGYRRTTVEGIAARAGVGKQTIYRWWSSKAEVLLEAFLGLAARMGESPEGAPFAFPDTGDLAADLRTVLRATVDELLDPAFAAPARALAAEGVVNADFGRQVVAELLEPQLGRYEQRLRAAQDTGAVRLGVDPRIALELLVAPLAQRWLQHTGEITHAYTDRLVDYALYGLAPRPDRA
ncbi:TetR/AcrR family transcriptional regulator [Streptomyces sp. NPDC050560]|uniref:TetR/AcrR family transcriptional regulator n=1 Tax=Streptomyces sp. NPDC050560 TaxID=3365630 RepID=UPI00379C6110